MSAINLDQLLIAALKEKDETTSNTVRSLKTAIKNREIEKGATLDDGEILDVLTKEAKKRKDARDMYLANNRQDLAEAEIAELGVIAKLLPEQLTGAALEEKIKQILSELPAEDRIGPKSIGPVMKGIKGIADTNEAQQVLKKIQEEL